jgi:iron complex outermembrane receptor protein
MSKTFQIIIGLIIFHLSITIGAFAQIFDESSAPGSIITGKVYDAETLSPLAFANVYIKELKIGSETETDGTYFIRYVPSGKFTFIVERLGYTSYQATITVDNNKILHKDIPLSPTTIEGGEVVVTASKREQTAQMAPASVVILRNKEIETRPITTFDQILENVPGISVYRSAGVSVQSLSIRGSSDVAGGGVGNRVLLMIDGRPALTSDAGGAYWSLVPTKFIERVEIVKGAFSSLYGSTAMGGVINVITRRPAYHSQTVISSHFGFYEKEPASIRYTEKLPIQTQYEVSHSGLRGRTSYLFNVSRKQSDGHADNTNYTFYDAFAKLLFDLKANRNLELTIGGGTSDNAYPHTWLNSSQPLKIREKFKDDRQEKKQLNTDIHYWAVPNRNMRYSSRFYWYKHDALSFFNENDPQQLIPGNEPFGSKTEVHGQKFGNINQFDIYLNNKNYLIFGTDYQIDKVESSPDSIMYGNQQVNNFGVFIQNEMTLHPRLTATMGLRYDLNHLVGWTTFDQLSPKLSMIYKITDNFSWRALYGQAFRAPTIAERFFKVEIAGGTLFDPNPLLGPEKMDFSFETGFRWQIKHNVDVDVALYRYHYKDMIYWEDITKERGVNFPFYQVRNLNKALIQGYELTANFHWQQYWQLAVNYTYVDARDKSTNRTDDLLPYKPKHQFNFTSLWTVNNATLNLNGRYRSKVDEVFLYPLQAPDEFWVFNAKLLYQISTLAKASIGINNIFDAEYEELARYRMPGRNWLFGLEFTF